MDCTDLEEHLTDFLEGVLDADSEAAALDHLASCERCELVLAQTRQVIQLASEHGGGQLGESDRDQMLQRIIGAINASPQQS